MINCENCPAKLDKNKSHCCGIIPFPIKFLEENKKLFQADGELKENGDTGAIITKDFRCVFLNRETFKCVIYDKRPKVCIDYGMIEELKCPYFKRSGNRRSPAGEKVTMREINKFVDKAIENNKKYIDSRKVIKGGFTLGLAKAN